MAHNSSKISGTGHSMFAFMQNTYNETATTLTEAIMYVERYSKVYRFFLTEQERMIHTLTMSTITAKLTSSMSWLMTQKALHNGDICMEQVKDSRYRLQSVNGFNLEQEKVMLDHVNGNIQAMFKKSKSIYSRVKNLEHQLVNKLMLDPTCQEQAS